VAATSATICPKCGHKRAAADPAPAWQCPACGIAYSKFSAAAASDSRVRTHSVGQADRTGSIAIIVYAGAFFGPVALTLAYPQTRAIEWAPAAVAACAFLFWLSAYRRLRMIEDVPTSTIASAAQGYVELEGTAAAAPGDALRGQLTGTPCIWYRYIWYTVGNDKDGDFGERGVPFLLRDATGDCVIDPAEAEVICDRLQKWTDGDRVFHEWSIRVGDRVYAIGNFTSGGPAARRHVDLKVAYALAAQERNADTFKARYDVNRDGKVDRQESAAARDAHRRDVERQFAGQGGAHTLGPSPDGRPFLVIGGKHRNAAGRYRLLAVAHLCVFLAALALGAHLWFQ
jgi:hypothetical protein